MQAHISISNYPHKGFRGDIKDILIFLIFFHWVLGEGYYNLMCQQ
jgi:hypothetical protein